MIGKVWLVGAGPGDAGLLTIRGREVLENADVVVYDSLIGQSILSLIPDSARLIFAGKRSGCHYLPQEETNRILLEEAMKGCRVVRLKGGDPFLFGRGGEELELLAENGVPFEVVPGVTSAIAVPAYNGIPVTHRDYASSVHIITGHRRNGFRPDIDYQALVKLDGTLVFLMGIAALEDICSGLLSAGMDPNMPAAVLERGTTADQRRIVATVGTITERCAREQVQTPAIILVGKVCSLEKAFGWYEKRPLAGVRVLLTRPRELISALAVMLRQEGAEVLELPAIRTEPAADMTPLRQAFQKLSRGEYAWVVFTSPSGVRIFFEELIRQADIRALGAVKLAAIGQGTQKALLQHGIRADFMPSVYDGDTLGKELAGLLNPGDAVLIPRASVGNPELPARLRAAGASVDDIPTYDTLHTPSRVLDEKALIESGDLDFAVFTSASTVRGFADSAAGTDLSAVNAVCIGRQTAAAASKLGMRTWTSDKATLASLVQKLEQAAAECRM